MARIHPEDVDLAIQSTNNYLEKKIPNYIVEYRLRCKDIPQCNWVSFSLGNYL